MLGKIITVILGALGGKKMEVGELIFGDLCFGFEAVNDLEEKLLKLLPGNGTNLEMVEALRQNFGNFGRDRGFGNIEGLIKVKT